MSPVVWAMITAGVLGFGIGVLVMYVAPVVQDWRAERRARRDRARRVDVVDLGEVRARKRGRR